MFDELKEMCEKELEEHFFKAFEIEPEYIYIGHYPLTDENGIIQPPKYPAITDIALLQLIIIRATNYKNGTVIELEPDSNIEDLKYEVLMHFINYRGSFDKHQIQQLFEEEE